MADILTTNLVSKEWEKNFKIPWPPRQPSIDWFITVCSWNPIYRVIAWSRRKAPRRSDAVEKGERRHSIPAMPLTVVNKENSVVIFPYLAAKFSIIAEIAASLTFRMVPQSGT